MRPQQCLVAQHEHDRPAARRERVERRPARTNPDRLADGRAHDGDLVPRRRVPRAPLPGNRREALDGALRRCGVGDRPRDRVFRQLLDRARQGQDLVARDRSANGMTSSTPKRPSVSVPVLSKIDRVDQRAFSNAIRLRTSSPLAAPQAVETATTSGIARPSACGQAMTMTVTARSIAYDSDSPEREPDAERERRRRRARPSSATWRRDRPGPASSTSTPGPRARAR